jgi:hypothetical protein
MAGIPYSWSALLLCVVHLLFFTVTLKLISALVKFQIVSMPPEVSNYPAPQTASTPMSTLVMNTRARARAHTHTHTHTYTHTHPPFRLIKFKLSHGLKHSIVLVRKMYTNSHSVFKKICVLIYVAYYSTGSVKYFNREHNSSAKNCLVKLN